MVGRGQKVIELVPALWLWLKHGCMGRFLWVCENAEHNFSSVT